MIKGLSDAIEKANVRRPSAYEAGYFAGLEAAEAIIEKAEPRYLTVEQYRAEYGQEPDADSPAWAKSSRRQWHGPMRYLVAKSYWEGDAVPIVIAPMGYGPPPDDWTPEQAE